MDISQEMLIDIALNGAGYLIAALLGITIYSMFKKGPKPVKVSPTQPETKELSEKVAEHQATTNLSNTQTDKKVEFIQFGQSTKNKTKSAVTPANNTKRNRSEVIRMANAMLAAGTEVEQIKKVLPISDSELALLKLNNTK